MARAPFSTSRVQIIFAEDDLVFREIATPAIAKAGIPDSSVHMADNGADALDVLISLQEGDVNDPIVMLLDMRMPRMDGQTCATRVNQLNHEGKLRRRPYLVCCSAGVEQVTFAEDESGSTFNLTMPKPFSNKEVALVLQAAGKWWTGGSPGCLAHDGGSTGSAKPRGSLAGGTGSGGMFGVNAVEVIVVHKEPICRMALVATLGTLGIDEDKVVECEGPEEIVEALERMQENRLAPLMVMLADDKWASVVGNRWQRRPFLVCTSLDEASNSAAVDAVLRKGFVQADVKIVLDQFQAWWTR